MQPVFILMLATTATVLQCHAAAKSSEQSDTAGSDNTGAKLALPVASTTIDNTGTFQLDVKNYNFPIGNAYRPFQNKGCPLCDSSVYPYCGEKLLHDACCCTDPYYSYDLPYQCKLADCRFLHANNCREHRLIATCCCSDDYRSLLKSFSNA